MDTCFISSGPHNFRVAVLKFNYIFKTVYEIKR
jgi:hypothetical protein